MVFADSICVEVALLHLVVPCDLVRIMADGKEDCEAHELVMKIAPVTTLVRMVA